jgi:hypothetical protein
MCAVDVNKKQPILEDAIAVVVLHAIFVFGIVGEMVDIITFVLFALKRR